MPEVVVITNYISFIGVISAVLFFSYNAAGNPSLQEAVQLYEQAQQQCNDGQTALHKDNFRIARQASIKSNGNNVTH